MLVMERTLVLQGAAGIGGAALGIRRLRRDKDGLFVKLCRSFVSRDTRIVLSMAIGELSISVVMVLDCLFGVLWMQSLASSAWLASFVAVIR